jgi:PDZ domain-containing protein
MRRAARILGWGLLLVTIVAAGWLRLPYYGIGPGPAREIAPLIRFDGPQRFESGGELVMTTVRWQQLTPISAVRVWLDDAWEAVPSDELFPPGLDRQQEEQRAISQMDRSKLDAAYVVLQRLTDYPDEHGEGALVENTFAPCPADGALFPGDLITAIDGETVISRDEASELIDAAEPGRSLVFRVEVDDEVHDVELSRERCVEGERRAFVGVSLLDAFPFDIAISSGEVGGPSAGLMWAIGLYDLLTPGDLTGGTRVAGTGTIDLEGNVGPIGGIRDKAIAAQRAGADLFLVPTDNMAELEDLDLGEMRLVEAATFDDAVEALRQAGGIADEAEVAIAA